MIKVLIIILVVLVVILVVIHPTLSGVEAEAGAKAKVIIVHLSNNHPDLGLVPIIKPYHILPLSLLLLLSLLLYF
jgi:hypothetical protein